MKITIEKVSNGFVLENEIVRCRPGIEAYTFVTESVGMRRIIAPTLEDVFAELLKMFPNDAEP